MQSLGCKQYMVLFFLSLQLYQTHFHLLSDYLLGILIFFCHFQIVNDLILLPESMLWLYSELWFCTQFKIILICFPRYKVDQGCLVGLNKEKGKRSRQSYFAWMLGYTSPLGGDWCTLFNVTFVLHVDLTEE